MNTPDFSDAETTDALLAQLAGYGSVCWGPDTPEGRVFDDAAASAGVQAALERLAELHPDKVPVTSPKDDPEFWYGLTIWGTGWSAQVRGERDGALALHLGEDVKRSSEDNHPAIIDLAETRRLRDLLNVATARGFL